MKKKSQNKLLHFENYENKNSFLKTNKKIVFQVIFKVFTWNCASYLIEFIECAMRAITIDYIKANV